MKKEILIRTILFLSLFITACSTSYEYAYLDEKDREIILSVAEEYIGMPYEWGGQSFPDASDGTVDCSGFVINVYKQTLINSGKSLLFADSTVRDIFLNYSDSAQEPLIGDLLFITDGCTDLPTHMGMYISSDDEVIKFIDASSLPDIMQVSIREYEKTNPKIHSIRKMRLRVL